MSRSRLNKAFNERVPSFDDVTALGLAANKGVDNQVALVVAPPGLWRYDIDSTATAGLGVVGSGTGRWLQVTGSTATGAKNLTALVATAGALGAYTQTGNVILADGNGAIGDIDGVTNVVGDVILLKDGADAEDNGLYVLDVIGDGSTAFQLTRLDGYDSSDEVSDGDRVEVQEGTANGEKTFRLTTNEVITLNTTGLTFRLELDPVDLASAATGLGASLVGVEDSGAFTAATDVEAAMAEMYQHLLSATSPLCSISLSMFREVDANGDVGNLAAHGGILASDSTPALQADAAESQELSWVTDGVQPIAIQVPLPPGFDGTADVLVEMQVSSVAGDTASFTVESGWDGGALVSDSATSGDAAARETITATIAAADIADAAVSLTLALTPGVHDSGAIELHSIRVLGKIALATS